MKKKLLISAISLILSLTVILAVGAFTAFATGEENGAQNQGEVAGDPAVTPETPETPEPQADQPAAETPAETAAENQPAAEPEQEQIYEYIYGYDEDVTSTYEEPQHLNELPEVEKAEVQEATAVVIPEVAVSDATMFSGIVMWLCVALGIAVIVGVMVSKRTVRRGA